MLDEYHTAGEIPATNSRSVTRELNLQNVFLGLDSFYLVLEYPHSDLFDKWRSVIRDLDDPRLYTGIVVSDYVVKRGALGYKLSIWDGDARLFITHQVNDALEDSPRAGQGMGVMLQLGAKWLCQHGDVTNPEQFKNNLMAQLTAFGIPYPEQYKARLNRIDIAIDMAGLRLNDLSIAEWQNGWVGRSKQKTFFYAPKTGQFTGLAIGSSSGAVRFKMYDKVIQSLKDGDYNFWASVWGNYLSNVARFEWSIKCYQAKFEHCRYLSEFTLENILKLLNYVSLDWGRLCLPSIEDENQSRWKHAPLWADLREVIEEWSDNYQGSARRTYHLTPDIKPAYLASLAGWLAGAMARIGLQGGEQNAASLENSLDYLYENGAPLSDIELKAKAKWMVAAKLANGSSQHVAK